MDPSAESRLGALASRQRGAFTLRQARECGMTDRVIRARIQHGVWRRLHPRVLCHASTPSSTELDLAAATLALRGACSHESAGQLHGMQPVPDSGPVVTIAASRCHRLEGVRVHRSQDICDRWITTVSGIPVTTAERTLLDLAGVVRERRLEHLVDHAIDHRIVTLDGLIGCFDALARRGRRGIATMRPVLEARADGAVLDTTELERMFTRLVRSAGLAEPERQVTLGGAELIGRADFLYRDVRLIVEVDGRLGHSQLLDFEDDRRRDQRAMVAGFRVVRFTYRQIRDRPDEVVDILRQLLTPPRSLELG